MNRPFLHRHSFRNLFLLALCLVIVLAVYAVPAQGAEPPAEASASVTFPGDPEPTPAPAQNVSLTFRMGAFGTKTIYVERGQYPSFSDIPQIPQLPAAYVLGWYGPDGVNVDPSSRPAETDIIYTARWSRRVYDLLNTDNHIAYIKGFSNNIFKPQNNVTRAEAAQMFYSLLRSKDWETKSFSDVPSGRWFSEAIGVMAGLGVINGYADGTFQPDRLITRAEFVTMAVACDTLAEGDVAFPDVTRKHWAYSYISTAAAKGWIGGFSDGTFQPDGKITRAQAVTVINRMLGRSPDPEVKEKTGLKNFRDVFPDYWAYGDIMEAASYHSYYTSGSGEVWTYYEQEELPQLETGWVKDGSNVYYLDGATQKFLRGEHTINGQKYLFDSSTGAAVTGFRMVGSWRRYYRNGLLMDDISGLGVVGGPYTIKVYKDSNYLIIFAKDSTGAYNTPVRAMRTSCGYGTPTGTFYTPWRYRWLCMVGNTWAQWCTQIQGSYLFHSVPNWTQSNMDLEVEEYNHLGDTRSMGCVRLNCRDAKWIFDNCALGTQVTITTAESSGPLAKPAGLAPLPMWHTWDPTDPTAYWRCQQQGCH